ncbi:MAG: hypothetical protein ACM3PC_05595 [Deltaproteobacteria bacterium]
MLTGIVIRGYVQTLEREGLLPGVRAAVPESTRKLIDKPPLVVSTVSGTVLDDLLVAVERQRGPSGPRAVARSTAHESFGPVLKPLLQGTMRMFGLSPAALLSRAGQLSALMVREVDFDYRPADEAAGTLTALFPSAPPRATFTAWEGICEFICDFAGVRGKVAPHRALDEGRRFEIDVRWEAAASASAA